MRFHREQKAMSKKYVRLCFVVSGVAVLATWLLGPLSVTYVLRRSRGNAVNLGEHVISVPAGWFKDSQGAQVRLIRIRPKLGRLPFTMSAIDISTNNVGERGASPYDLWVNGLAKSDSLPTGSAIFTIGTGSREAACISRPSSKTGIEFQIVCVRKDGLEFDFAGAAKDKRILLVVASTTS
jgi:hypothetical protein